MRELCTIFILLVPVAHSFRIDQPSPAVISKFSHTLYYYIMGQICPVIIAKYACDYQSECLI